jgi:hypothetical protein
LIVSARTYWNWFGFTTVMNSLIYLLINYNLKISQVNQLELKSRRLQLKFHFDFTIFLSKQTNSLKMTGSYFCD